MSNDNAVIRCKAKPYGFAIVNEYRKQGIPHNDKDYICRQELIENLNRFAPEHYSVLVNNLIIKQPSAKVKEVVYCKNLRAEFNSLFECSACGWTDDDTYTGDTDTYNFCPNCGAKVENN